MLRPEVCLHDHDPTGVAWENGAGGYWIGHAGVTRMRVVQVPGPMGFHPWIEIYKGDTLLARVNCCLLEEIRYDN